MQGLELPFGTPEGPETVFLAPRQTVEVPDNWRSKVSENLVHRRMLRITNVIDKPTLVNPTPSIKKPRKSK